MKNKKIIAIIALIIGLIMVGGAVLLLTFNQGDEPVKPKDNEDIYGTDLEKDLTAKAMIYAAEKYNYTTESYEINVSEKDNNFIVEVKSKDGQLVENITIKKDDLQGWSPDNASPEEIIESGEEGSISTRPE